MVEMLTGKRPFSEYTEKMAVIFGLGQESLSLDRLISGPGFSDEAQEFLRLCIKWYVPCILIQNTSTVLCYVGNLLRELLLLIC